MLLSAIRSKLGRETSQMIILRANIILWKFHLLRITSTFQATKLLESYYKGQKGDHNISIIGGNWE